MHDEISLRGYAGRWLRAGEDRDPTEHHADGQIS